MPLSFMTPLLLGAAAFAVIPWVLHHIRRPERKPVTFSSLMFVPDVKKEVIERRRLQHVLLMLLRIAVLMLLAFAFARPFLPLPPAIVAAQGGNSRHVIAIDTSYSMTAGGAFDTAKREALKIIDDLDANAQVAVIAFGASPRELNSMSTREDARLAVSAAEPTLETTAYEPALRLAGELLANGNDSELERSVVHFITDFQVAGMPETASTWRLPEAIEFNPIDVRAVDDNVSVADLHLVEPASGDLSLRTKIKNWSSDAAKSVDVRLTIDGAPQQENTVDAAPGNASQVSFKIAKPGEGGLRGWVEVDDPSLAADNRRYFTWNPPLKRRALIVSAPEEGAQWPVGEILRLAVVSRGDSVWEVDVADTPASDAASSADVVVVADASSLATGDVAALTEVMENGGSTLIVLGSGSPSTALLSAMGLEALGRRFEALDPIQFATLSWLDFKHPVFIPFAGSRFNDFSGVRFYNHHVLAPIQPGGGADVHGLARFEPVDAGDGPLAIVASTAGTGRSLVWAFDLGFEWTNLAKTARFVPLLHESLVWLTGGAATPRTWLIGEQPAAPRVEFERAVLASPGEETRPYVPAALDQTGFLEWHAAEPGAPVCVEPVNVDSREGNPAAIAPAEFALRLCSSPVLRENLRLDETHSEADGGNNRSSWEYGRFVLVAVLAGLLGEIWYAGRLR
jgi:hypothetical protein